LDAAPDEVEDVAGVVIVSVVVSGRSVSLSVQPACRKSAGRPSRRGIT